MGNSQQNNTAAHRNWGVVFLSLHLSSVNYDGGNERCRTWGKL